MIWKARLIFEQKVADASKIQQVSENLLGVKWSAEV
jgi:hypothetical protein